MTSNVYSIFFNWYNKQGILRNNRNNKLFSLNLATFLALKFMYQFSLKKFSDSKSQVIKNVIDFLNNNEISLSKTNTKIVEFSTKIPLKVIQIEVTNKCNLRCKHCYLPDYSKELDRKKISSIVYEAKQLGVMDVDFTGGEPLLLQGLSEIIEEVLKEGMCTTIFTNAVYIPEDFKILIQRYDGIRLKVSLDGWNETIHDSIRGRGTFKRTIKNIEYFRSLGVPVTINVVLNNKNISGVKYFLELFDRLDVKYAFDRFLPFERNNQLSISDEEFNNAILCIPNIQANCNNISESTFESFYCGAGNSYVFINSSGDVGFCPTLSSTKFCGGNINEKTLSDIWINSKFFNHIRNVRCKYYNECPANYVCQGGCRSRAQFFGGSIGSPDIQECKLAYNLTGIKPKSMSL